jgi:hypothetical protein
VVAGVASTPFGLHRTALVYFTVIAALATVAAGSLIFRSRPAALPPDPAAAPDSDTRGR